ncbi:MAG: tetratricopeptide repeat protein, partial [bacterium]|nr:tetratricopeptide repeat protein [bacterium]
ADIDPSNVMVRVKLAERYVKEGLIAEASEQILKLGDEYKKQGKPEDIIKLYEKFAALDQSNKEIYIGLGTAYTETGDLEKALSSMKHALQIDSDDTDILFTLTDLYKQKGDLDKAKSSLQHILKVDSMSIPARKEIATIYLESGDDSRGFSEFEMLIDLYLKDELFDDALGVIEYLKEKIPNDTRVIGKLVEIHWMMKDPDKQIESYRDLAKLYMSKGEEAKAREVYASILELRPVDEEAKRALGSASEIPEADKEPEAAETAESMGPLSRDEITKVFTEVDVYLKYNMEDKVEAALKSVISRNANNIEARLKLKDFYLSSKKNDEAVGIYLDVVNIYKDLEEEEKAVECLKGVLKLDPSHSEASEMLKSLAGDLPSEEELDLDMPDEIELEIDDGMDFDMDAEPELEIEEEPVEAELEEELVEAELEEELVEAELEEELVEAELEEEPLEAELEEEPLEAELEEEPLEAEAVPDEAFEENLLDLEPLEDLEPIEDIEALDEEDEVELIEELTPLEEDEEEVLVLDTVQPLSIADVGELLEEAQFYIHQELFAKARESLDSVTELDPGNSSASDMLLQLEALEQNKLCEFTPEKDLHAEEAFFDLSAELSAEISEKLPAEASASTGDSPLGFDDLFDSFKAGVATQVSEGDSDTHYNLGIAYKEMGLFNDAIEEFKLAMKDPAKKFDSYSMLGLCCLDHGMTEDAIEYFKIGLDSEGITRQAEISLNYELGLAYKKAGMMAEALSALGNVYSGDKSFRDIDREYTELKAQKEKAGGEDLPGMETLSEHEPVTEDKENPKDKVSYI